MTNENNQSSLQATGWELAVHPSLNVIITGIQVVTIQISLDRNNITQGTKSHSDILRNEKVEDVLLVDKSD